MQPIIYDVAVSADGYIAGPCEDITKFPASGPVIDDYLDRLKSYSCAIMGRATYEFGYRFDLEPGSNPYPHMHSVVFSRHIDLPADAEVEIVRRNTAERIEQLRRNGTGPMYLCGGGQFAGWLLSLGMIDKLRLKRAPVFLGGGTRLFGDRTEGFDVRLLESKLYEDGFLYQEFDLS